MDDLVKSKDFSGIFGFDGLFELEKWLIRKQMAHLGNPPVTMVIGDGNAAYSPKEKSVGTVTRKQVEEIARTKMPDLNAFTLDAAVKIIEGTARSVGIEVAG